MSLIFSSTDLTNSFIFFVNSSSASVLFWNTACSLIDKMFQQEISNAELDKKHLIISKCRDIAACFGYDIKHPDHKDPESCGGHMLYKILRSNCHTELSDTDVERLKVGTSRGSYENI